MTESDRSYPAEQKTNQNFKKFKATDLNSQVTSLKIRGEAQPSIMCLQFGDIRYEAQNLVGEIRLINMKQLQSNKQ